MDGHLVSDLASITLVPPPTFHSLKETLADKVRKGEEHAWGLREKCLKMKK